MVDKFKMWLFAELWKELGESGEVDITFLDGVTHPLSEEVEICWNNEHDEESDSINP